MLLRGFGECLPRWDNYVQIDPNVVDSFGIPVLHIHMTYGENERAIINDMRESGEAMMEAAGAKNIRSFAVPDREPGRGIHEVGVARMGDEHYKAKSPTRCARYRRVFAIYLRACLMLHFYFEHRSVKVNDFDPPNRPIEFDRNVST